MQMQAHRITKPAWQLVGERFPISNRLLRARVTRKQHETKTELTISSLPKPHTFANSTPITTNASSLIFDFPARQIAEKNKDRSNIPNSSANANSSKNMHLHSEMQTGPLFCFSYRLVFRVLDFLQSRANEIFFLEIDDVITQPRGPARFSFEFVRIQRI